MSQAAFREGEKNWGVYRGTRSQDTVQAKTCTAFPCWRGCHGAPERLKVVLPFGLVDKQRQCSVVFCVSAFSASCTRDWEEDACGPLGCDLTL